MKRKPSIPNYLVYLIEDALAHARMNGFGHSFDEKENQTVIEATRIYRETWIIEPLLTALRAAHGDERAIAWAKEKLSHAYGKRDAKWQEELKGGRNA